MIKIQTLLTIINIIKMATKKKNYQDGEISQREIQKNENDRTL